MILKSARADGTVSFHKLIWGEQFGFGVRYSQNTPNATGKSHASNDPGCPKGCLYDILEDPGEYNDLSSAEPLLFRSVVACCCIRVSSVCPCVRVGGGIAIGTEVQCGCQHRYLAFCPRACNAYARLCGNGTSYHV